MRDREGEFSVKLSFGGRHEEATFEEQIFNVLKKQDVGFSVKEIIRLHGIAEQIFFRWKSNFGGMEASDAKRLRELEPENAKLEKLLAEQKLDNAALKDVVLQKW